MRRHASNDRLLPGEITASLVDDPERDTFVESSVEPTTPNPLEVAVAAGDVFIDGTPVSVSAQTETVTDISGQVTETAYRYHTLSLDGTGALVVQASGVGEFDADAPDDPPLTQVTEPSHPEGNVYLGVAFQIEGQIERVYDGRYFSTIDSTPSGVISMWSGEISEIPTGWTLCDGTDGTPDLRNRFVVGAGDQYAVDDTGGADEVTLTESEMPSHTHDTTAYDGEDGSFVQSSNAFQTQRSISTDATGGDEPHENRPPFYALAFIMRV